MRQKADPVESSMENEDKELINVFSYNFEDHPNEDKDNTSNHKPAKRSCSTGHKKSNAERLSASLPRKWQSSRPKSTPSVRDKSVKEQKQKRPRKGKPVFRQVSTATETKDVTTVSNYNDAGLPDYSSVAGDAKEVPTKKPQSPSEVISKTINYLKHTCSIPRRWEDPAEYIDPLCGTAITDNRHKYTERLYHQVCIHSHLSA